MIEELLNSMKHEDQPADAQARFVLYLMGQAYGGELQLSVNQQSDRPFLVECTCNCPTCRRFNEQVVYEPSSELFLALANYCKQREDFAMQIGPELEASTYLAATMKKGNVR